MSSILRNLGIANRGPDAHVLREPMFVLSGVVAFVGTKHILATIKAPTLRSANRKEPISAMFSNEPVSLQQRRVDEVFNFSDQKTHYQPALDMLQANCRLSIRRP